MKNDELKLINTELERRVSQRTGELKDIIIRLTNEINERRRAEEALRESEEKFRKITTTARDAIIILDNEGNISFWNEAAEKMFGYSVEEVSGKDMHELFAPQRYHEAYQKGYRIFKTSGHGPFIDKTLELWAMKKDGIEFPVELSVSAVRLKDKWHALGIVRDIKERRKAEETLLKERNFSDILINSMPGIFYLFDEKGSFVRWNRNFEKVSEYSASEIKSMTPLDFFMGNDKQIISERIGNVFETGQATAEAGFVSKSGRQTPHFFTGLLIKIEDNPYLAGVGIDITERKNAEEALRKTMQDLERSNRELEQFAYIASHDLQEPLRMVSSFMQLLSERYKGRFDADADDFIHYAVDGANRMQLMINDLLAYSRVGTKGGVFKVADSNRILEQTLTDMKFPIEETGGVVTHDRLPSVTVDATQISQVFQNLISNAIKFKGDKKPEVQVSAVKKGNEWVFSVKDNGIGFEQKYADRIFDTFKRLHTVAKYPGSGIGLTICRKIIERHGGRIWAESEPGKGSIFYFTIPDKKDS